MHRVLHARQIVINHINSSNSADALKTTYRCQGKREKKKKTMVPLYLMMAPLESSASFRASEALQRFTKKKNKKRRKKERRKENERKTKKKKRRRNNNGIVIACWERRAIACRFSFFFFFLERKTTNIFEMELLTNSGSKDRASFQRFFFFLLFIFVSFILFNYRIVRFAVRVR